MQADSHRLLPWHNNHWQQVSNSIQQNRLPHALLITGINGLGKTLFANYLANYLLCSNNNNAPCGNCEECRLFNAGTHPDSQWLTPDEDSDTIKIEQIRKVIYFSQQSKQRANYKTVIVEPAHALNQSAANALLKTLEEPNDNSLFILISDKPALLPATIRSRCQIMIFNAPEEAVALTWLKQQNLLTDNLQQALALSNGAPLNLASTDIDTLLRDRLQLQQHLLALLRKKISIVEATTHWKDKNHDLLLSWIQNWLLDILRYKLTNNKTMLENNNSEDFLADIADYFTIDKLWQCYQSSLELKADLNTNIKLNNSLFLEDFFAVWQK